jgi:hypothetical protein
MKPIACGEKKPNFSPAYNKRLRPLGYSELSASLPSGKEGRQTNSEQVVFLSRDNYLTKSPGLMDTFTGEVNRIPQGEAATYIVPRSCLRSESGSAPRPGTP